MAPDAALEDEQLPASKDELSARVREAMGEADACLGGSVGARRRPAPHLDGQKAEHERSGYVADTYSDTGTSCRRRCVDNCVDEKGGDTTNSAEATLIRTLMGLPPQPLRLRLVGQASTASVRCGFRSVSTHAGIS